MIDDFLSKSVTEIETNVVTIPDYAFYKQSNLKSVTMPNVKSIGLNAFQNCSSLENITLPETLTNLQGLAFSGCTSLKSIIIPKNIKAINAGTFNDCTALEEVQILGQLDNITSQAFRNTSFNTLDLKKCTQIHTNAFFRDRYIEGVGLKTLILRSDWQCTNLSAINAFTNTPIGKLEAGSAIYVHDKLVELYKRDTNWSVYSDIIKPLSELGA